MFGDTDRKQLDIGRLKPSEFTLKQLRNCQPKIFSPWASNDLDADGRTLRRRGTSNHRAGPAGQVTSHRAVTGSE